MPADIPPGAELSIPSAVISFKSGNTLTVPGPIDAVVEMLVPLNQGPDTPTFVSITGFDHQRCWVRVDLIETICEGATPRELHSAGGNVEP